MISGSSTRAVRSTIVVAQHERVLGRCRAWIADGTWRLGERIPSERELAELLGVNRKAVHAAILSLQREGLLELVSPRIRAVPHQIQNRSTGLYDTVAVLSGVEDQYVRGLDPEAGHGILIGVIEAVQGAGLSPLTLDPRRVDAASVRRLIAERPRGVLLMQGVIGERSCGAVAATLIEAGIPVAAYADVLTESELVGAQFDRVRSDQAAGSASLVRYLAERGCRRLLRAWDNAVLERVPEWRQERDHGVVTACAELGLPAPLAVEPLKLAVGPHPARTDFERHVRMMAGFLYEHLHGPEPVDAILALSDKPAFYIHAACRLLGREPGRDVTIVGYDDVWRGFGEADFVGCPVSATVRKNMAGIGGDLVRLLQQRVAGELPAAPQTRVVSPHLIPCD
jgi:DNA-binding LacI/PurR family transcriptional regulator